MTVRAHLIFRLQGRFSLLRDLLPLYQDMCRASQREIMRRLCIFQREVIEEDLEVLERALDLLSARRLPSANPMLPGVQKAMADFDRRMSPSGAQRDTHTALIMLTVCQMIRGAYQGDIELARAIGEQDIAKLLEENLFRQTRVLHQLRDSLPLLIEDTLIQEAARRVA